MGILPVSIAEDDYPNTLVQEVDALGIKAG